MRLSVLLVAALSLAQPAARGDVSFSSGVQQVALIELYTSEGCSSCPAADRWLATLQDDKRLWREFVPVSFHVSYWDRLGWRDQFAHETYTKRQYALAATWASNTVYTPCFVRNGVEWRSRDLNARSTDSPGVLRATCVDDGEVRITFQPTEPGAASAYEAHVALLGGGLKSIVRRGENAGRTLAHAFVVLSLRDAPISKDASGALVATITEAASARDPAALRHALAVWVTRQGQLAPLQATGGWLGE